ncbi:MAG TPA: hypothetical protein VH207_04960 [Chthoniobacterales bacterium]|nr:hypothetical protein [Chthoniobacterales bacterium]
MRSAWVRSSSVFGEGNAADTGTSRRPGLDLDHDLAAKFLCRGNGLIRRVGSFAARNFETVGGENFLPLIFVQSSHAAISTTLAKFSKALQKGMRTWMRLTPTKAGTTPTVEVVGQDETEINALATGSDSIAFAFFFLPMSFSIT